MTMEELIIHVIENTGFAYDEEANLWYCQSHCDKCTVTEACIRIFGTFDTPNMGAKEANKYKTIYPEYFV